MKEKLRFISPAIVIAALAATAFFLLKLEDEYLWKVQELNLHLDTPVFLHQQMVTSGWLLTWLGTWLTEFFYHAWMGVGVLCLWWAVLMAVLWRTFRIPLKWTVVLLVPVAALLLGNVTLGYWIYYLKLRGLFFAATIGATVAAAAVWLYRLLPARYFVRPLFAVVSTAVLYPLVGFYGLLATLLMVIITWRIEGTAAGRLVATVAGVLAVVAVPLLYYNYVYYQTSITNIWWTGLPLFVMDEEYHAYYIPYYIRALSMAVMAALYRPQHQ